MPSALLVGVLRVRLRLAAGHRPVVPHAHAAPAHPEALGLPGVQTGLMLRGLRPGADSAFSLAAGAGSHGAGRQDEANNSDPLTLAEYVTQCPKISVR